MASSKITVELSREDRALLESIRDAIKGDRTAIDTVRRLIEDKPEAIIEAVDHHLQETYPADPTGAIEEHYFWHDGAWHEKPDHKLMESHFDMETKGFIWNGTDWVPKE